MSVIIERPLRDRLRVEVLDPATPFVLDMSLLNDGVLGETGAAALWTDYAGQATSIVIQRGAAREGLLPQQRPGLATVTLYDWHELDPSAPVFAANRQLRVTLLTGSGTYELFRGKLREAGLVYVQPRPGAAHVPVTTLTIVDAVADHDQITRYGALPPAGSETFGQRIRRLRASAATPIELPAQSTYSDIFGNEIKLARTVYEGSLSSHFTLACATVGAMWWVGGDGVTRFAPRAGSGFVVTPTAEFWFSSTDFGPMPADALRAIDAGLAAGSRVTYTVGIARNITAVEDPDNPGQWKADEVELQYREPLPENGADTRLGRSPVVTTINAATPTIHRLWEQQFPYAGGSEQIESLLWNAQQDLDRIPDLEIGNVIRAYHPARGLWNGQIIGVQHTITPTRWMIQLTLIGGAL
jgi:hypothetical protein